jgi:hypothetical protein
MALLAVLSEFILMRVPVAARTAGKLNTFEFLEFIPVHHLNFVAFLTINRFMFTVKLESGSAVVEV